MIGELFSSLEKVHPRSLKALHHTVARLIKGRLWLQIIIAMILGVATGVALSPDVGWVERDLAVGLGEWLALPGQIFLAVIQMIVVPLILASIIRGIAAASDIQQLKSTGFWVAIYFLGTTVIAVTLGITLGLVLRPGSYVDPGAVRGGQAGTVQERPIDAQPGYIAAPEADAPDSIPERFTEILPTNPMSAIVEGDMLQIVIFAIVFGIGLLSLRPDSSKPLLDLFGSVQQVCMAIVGSVMVIAPLAVFGLLAQAMIRTGPQVLAGLGMYVAIVILGMGLLLIVYMVIALLLGGVRPRRFFDVIREPFLLGFSTNSSAATMPITIRSAEDVLKARPSIAQFIVPLGATVNMGGTALYQGLAAIFMAQMFAVDMPIGALIALIATAVGASIGTPAVPGVGIIVLASVLNGAGIPLGGLALIVGVDRILERFRTSLNVTGDLVACAVMDRHMPATVSKEQEVARAEEHEKRREAKDEDVLVNSA